ncbi:hypothetical protein N2152v2_004418 [Parachlorella kessleri]
MVDAFRAALDELMGKDRDLPPEERKGRRARFYDPEVCKHDLCGLCPFNLFFNTKSDLGGCEFDIHEDHIDFESCKEEWDALAQRDKDKYGYERGLLKVLQRLVAEMDRKIDKQQERARLESQPKVPTPTQQAELDGIKQKIKEVTDESGKLAEGGDVDASLAAVQQAERLQREHERLQKKYTEPDRYIMVCEVCGVFIQSTDNEARRRDHIEGKQYLGWKAIREKCAELEEKYKGLAAGGYGSSGALREPPGGGVGSGANAFPVSSGVEHQRSSSRGAERDKEEGEYRGEHQERSRGERERDRGRRYGGGGGSSRGEEERGGRYRDERGRDSGRRERDRSYERRRQRGAEYPPPDYSRRGGGSSRGYDDKRGYY